MLKEVDETSSDEPEGESWMARTTFSPNKPKTPKQRAFCTKMQDAFCCIPGLKNTNKCSIIISLPYMTELSGNC